MQNQGVTERIGSEQPLSTGVRKGEGAGGTILAL